MLREGLIRDAAGLLRNARGHLLPGQRSSNPTGVSKTAAALDAIPEDASLDEVLAVRLGKKGAVKLADSLIGLATGPKPTLQAIQYIYDRLEGKPRQAITETKEYAPEFISLMKEFYVNEPVKIEPTSVLSLTAPADFSVIEAGIREVLSEEAEA